MCHGFCEVPSLLPWCLVTENKSQMLGIYLHKHFKGIRSSFNNKGKKKTRHVLCRNLLSQHIHLLCKWEYFLKNIMGNVDASKISKIFNLFLFHSLALRDVHILILSNLSYWLVQHKYHASRHVERHQVTRQRRRN